MPKSTSSVIKEREKDKNIVQKIKIQQVKCGMQISDIAKYTPIKATALYNRIKKPEEFSIKELRVLCKILKISMKELLEMEE